eukprot:128094-Chlamydomonas_euryale.AAC.1
MMYSLSTSGSVPAAANPGPHLGACRNACLSQFDSSTPYNGCRSQIKQLEGQVFDLVTAARTTQLSPDVVVQLSAALKQVERHTQVRNGWRTHAGRMA